MTVRSPGDTAAAEAELQQQVLDFLDGSSFGPAKGGKRIDTHASMVFLGADRALKIKRAVRLPFLDYSTLEKRKRACEEELKANAGDAPELYRRVVAITRNSDGTFEIDGTGTPVEWAVEMTRFDDDQSLDRVAASKTIDPSLATAVADAILDPTRMRRAQTVRAGLPPFHPSSNATPQRFTPCADLMPLPSISSMRPAAILRRHCSRCCDYAPGKGSCAVATAICTSPILPWWTAGRCCSTPSNSIP